jgi:hypothetical protein
MFLTVAIGWLMIGIGSFLSSSKNVKVKIKWATGLAFSIILFGIVVHPNYLIYSFFPSPYVYFKAPSQVPITNSDEEIVSLLDGGFK